MAAHSDRANAIEVPIRVFAVNGARTAHVDTTWSYLATSPYEVSMWIDDLGGRHAWAFARDLLVEGLVAATGIGDVRVCPYVGSNKGSVGIGLSSPDGSAVFEVPRAKVVHFLRRTYGLVPRGKESGFMDLDREVDLLLGGGGSRRPSWPV